MEGISDIIRREENPMNNNRHQHLLDLMQANHLDMLVLNPGPTLTYLTGLHFHLSERPTLLWIKAGKTPALILPALETGKAEGSTLPVKLFPYGDDPSSWQSVFQAAAEYIAPESSGIGIEPERLRMLEYRYIQQAAPKSILVPAGDVLTPLRIQKDEVEVNNIRQAVKIAENAFVEFRKHLHPGMTERQAAAELTIQLLHAGSDVEIPFTPIIASGPNSANPHAFPTERYLSAGDLVVVDWGAAYQGYISDLTRTIALAYVTSEAYQIHQVVLKANEKARTEAAPNIHACELDQAARSVIEKEGYGKYFTHRVGHGIGMEAHENPYMHGTNEELLQPGMVFTIEPGIYLSEIGGVRIEDNVVINEKGSETLSVLPRELYVIQ